jgi:hypothetical protein
MRWRQRHRWGGKGWLWLLWLVIGSWPVVGMAHGSGTPRLANVAAGPYRLWVWSLPEPVRLGEMHLSVAVATPEATTDLTVTIDLAPVAPSAPSITLPTSKQERWLETYYEVDWVIPTTGEWSATVQVRGPADSGQASFAFTVLPAPTVNWTLISWGALAFVAVLGMIWVRRGGSQ